MAVQVSKKFFETQADLKTALEEALEAVKCSEDPTWWNAIDPVHGHGQQKCVEAALSHVSKAKVLADQLAGCYKNQPVQGNAQGYTVIPRDDAYTLKVSDLACMKPKQ